LAPQRHMGSIRHDRFHIFLTNRANLRGWRGGRPGRGRAGRGTVGIDRFFDRAAVVLVVDCLASALVAGRGGFCVGSLHHIARLPFARLRVNHLNGDMRFVLGERRACQTQNDEDRVEQSHNPPHFELTGHLRPSSKSFRRSGRRQWYPFPKSKTGGRIAHGAPVMALIRHYSRFALCGGILMREGLRQFLSGKTIAR
jgi:hypothetical protein